MSTRKINNEKTTVDINPLTTGVYFIKLGTATQKFIKQ